MSSLYDDSGTLDKLREWIAQRKILIICPGASISVNKKRICEFVRAENAFVISVNFKPDFLDCDVVFCANIKRANNLRDIGNTYRVVTSNLTDLPFEQYEKVSYQESVHFQDVFCEDSTLMLLNVLFRAGIREISIAGFDGFSSETPAYYSDDYTLETGKTVSADVVKNILKTALAQMRITFITPSLYYEMTSKDL